MAALQQRQTMKLRNLLKVWVCPEPLAAMLIKFQSCFSVCTKIDASLDVESVLKAIKKGSVSAQVTRGSIRF